jgi:hypothetical protein
MRRQDRYNDRFSRTVGEDGVGYDICQSIRAIFSSVGDIINFPALFASGGGSKKLVDCAISMHDISLESHILQS